jgi:hypothetical protein
MRSTVLGHAGTMAASLAPWPARRSGLGEDLGSVCRWVKQPVSLRKAEVLTAEDGRVLRCLGLRTLGRLVRVPCLPEGDALLVVGLPRRQILDPRAGL